ncbi:helix-turn-helix transcriptional regulator [Pseudoflavitalea sp. G-6-1-2]|uniref:helix-turn-helix domain-containing protein n=1 Tax=Pseudoflavitalea sp. G-6-1-2 TaxID=2728841 RepID=UPI00146A6E77|nr:AraC family transcriptional regulator [Pseudoflavitalea sp. G-6-1-2]NML20798.1 helix-turn-helix transcriptional regulator [Pseudoflavitalea sp. G-6-1-2]
MTIYIRNMISPECEAIVKAAFRQMKLRVIAIRPGAVETAASVSTAKLMRLQELLERSGFSILEDKKQVLTEQIKVLIIYLVHHQAETRLKLSGYISETLQYDYHYLSSLFSEMEGITIEKFLIQQRIEKIKLLLSVGEMPIAAIAKELNYSSAAYLTIQFKKSTGFTPGIYRKINLRMPALAG